MELTRKEKHTLLSIIDANLAEVEKNLHMVNQHAIEELAEEEYKELLESIRKKVASDS